MTHASHDEYVALRFADSRATRHLCIGTYLDHNFQCQVLDEVYNEPNRAVAPAAGADAAVVVLHAKHARLLSIIQYTLLPTIVAVFLYFATIDTFTVIGILVAWQLAVAFVKLLITGSRAADTQETGNAPRLAVQFIVLIVVFVLYLQFGGLTLIRSFLTGLLPSEAMSGNDTDFGARDPVIIPTQPDRSLVFVVLLLLMSVVAGFAILRNIRIQKLRDGVGDLGLDDAITEYIRYAQYGDVVTYSGYTPFIGHGKELLTWQFALPLYPNETNPDRDIGTDGPGFTTAELIGAISTGLGKYAKDSPGFRGLPELVISDQFFVSDIDTNQPVQFVEDLSDSDLPHDVTAIKSDPTLPVRHYLKCQVNAWEGELVTTVFATAAVQGETLYMEFVSRMLPPTKLRYHVAKNQYRGGRVGILLDALQALGQLPLHILRTPLILGRHLRDAVRAGLRNVTSTHDSDRTFDHGAKVSVRELGTDFSFHGYFQKHDAIKYTSILQAQILEHTVNFLERFIDVSELKQRKETIVNNTVVNKGDVYTASQTGAGFVGAQGNRAQGTATAKGR